MILVNKKEARILFIPHFLPNSYAYEGRKILEEGSENTNKEKNSSKKKNYSKYKKLPGEENLREISKKAELEADTTLLYGNIRYSVTAEKQNFNNTITVNENNIIVLGQEKILSAKLFYWEDYLKYVQKQWDWLVCLKIALDIYHGEIKGYYGVPYVKEERQRALQHQMMNLIEEGIKSMIKNFKQNNNAGPNNSYSADIIAIKAAVEFWNRIDKLNFLFTRILRLFSEQNLEHKFIENLEPFILNGYFKDHHLPDLLLQKIWDYYFKNNKYHNFERIVSKLNFSHYIYFDNLKRICQEKLLTTALIHLIISSTIGTDKKACMQILNNVYSRFKQAKKFRTLDEVKEILLKDEESKFSIEASYEYIGIKLMFIIKLFLQGNKFPSGKLSKPQRIEFLAQSIEFLLREEEATELMKLNARTFFNVVSEIYKDHFISETLVKHNDKEKWEESMHIPHDHLKIIEILYGHVLTIQNEKFIKFEYSYFILKIAGSDFLKENAFDFVSKVYNSALNVMQELIKLKNSPVDPHEIRSKYIYSGPKGMKDKDTEVFLLRVIKYYSSKMQASELDDLVQCVEDLKFDKLKIHLYEQKQEFHKCLMIYLESTRVEKEEIFQWLSNLSKKKHSKKEEKIEQLKIKISEVIEDLVSINATKTGNIIDEWLPDKQKEVINKLGKNPKLQLRYLESYLTERESDIIEKFAASSLQSRTSMEAINYRSYLILHIELLAKNNSPKLIEMVNKSHYPLECLENVPKNSTSLIQEARAYLKKREGMFSESIKIFIGLLRSIDPTSIEEDLFSQGQIQSHNKEHMLSFTLIFNEICDNLKLHSKRNRDEDGIWIETLQALFSIKDSVQNSEQKASLNTMALYSKISELMELMSEFVDFNKIIEILLKIDSNLSYQHAKAWFTNLHISKNDQEVLYTSAKRLLSNENCTLIDSIIQKNNIGFLGERDRQLWAICHNSLGNATTEQAFVLTQCSHQFHNKCFFEELKNKRLVEGYKSIRQECPICQNLNIDIDPKKRGSGRSRRRGRGRKRKETQDEESITESEDETSGSSYREKEGSTRSIDQIEKEFYQKNEDSYKQKLAAFDEDFAASQLNLMIG